MKLITLMTILTLLNGCALFETEVKENPVIPDIVPIVRSELDELLEFGADMAGKPSPVRADQCRSLLKRQKESPDTRIQLQLMVGRLLSDACGDIPKIIDGVAAIPKEKLTDDKLQNLLTIQMEALKVLNTQSKKLGTLERKQKNLQTLIESKEHGVSKSEESRLLREKLKAIRTMEKQLDESAEGN